VNNPGGGAGRRRSSAPSRVGAKEAEQMIGVSRSARLMMVDCKRYHRPTMPEQNNPCPVCDRADVKKEIRDLGAVFRCHRCGTYSTDMRFGAVLRHADFARLRLYLSAYLRQASEHGEVVPVRYDTWHALAEGHAYTPVSRKLEMLLRLFCKRSVTGGKSVALNTTDDFVLVDAPDDNEMVWLIEALVEQQALRNRLPIGCYEVTPKGWERNSPMYPGGVPGTCFVAMAFHPLLDGVYESGIKPAVEASGLTVINVGKVQYNGIVTDLIHAEIRRAEIIVADVTSQRQTVYFEAGLAIGLGRTVIWSCREDEIKEVHFDTRQYSHVLWKDAADLREKLEHRIRGTLTIPVKH
jgi:hypothetical protein